MSNGMVMQHTKSSVVTAYQKQRGRSLSKSVMVTILQAKVIQDIQGDGNTTYQINYDTISDDSDITHHKQLRFRISKVNVVENIKAKVI
jgi:hypothetical protein